MIVVLLLLFLGALLGTWVRSALDQRRGGRHADAVWLQRSGALERRRDGRRPPPAPPGPAPEDRVAV